jgi:aryl-alcohol dehydrogenase-like predicted oxidoreductase
VLRKRLLGRTGLEVTELGFGASELRGGKMWGPERPDSQAGEVLNAAVDAGINFIDTALDYGRSEELIGNYISNRRSQFYIESKVGCIPGEMDNVQHVHTAANIRAGIEHSLRMLKTDYLDVVLFHHSISREQMEADGGLEELIKLKEEGKTRFIGVSATLPNMADHLDMGVFDVFQVPYSVVDRAHENIIRRASEAGAGIVIRGGVARGGPSDWDLVRDYDWSIRSRPTGKAVWEQAKLDELLDGMSPMEFTLRYTLSNDDLDTTIVGTSNLEHFRDNLAAAEKGPLPADVVTEVNRRLEATTSKPAS